MNFRHPFSFSMNLVDYSAIYISNYTGVVYYAIDGAVFYQVPWKWKWVPEMYFSHQAEGFDMLHAILWSTLVPPPPWGTPRGEFFKVEILSSGGFLGTLNTIVILLKVYLNVGGHFTLRVKVVFCPLRRPRGWGKFLNPIVAPVFSFRIQWYIVYGGAGPANRRNWRGGHFGNVLSPRRFFRTFVYYMYYPLTCFVKSL